MLLNDLLLITTPFAVGCSKFTIDLANMNANSGRQYYNELIDNNIQMSYGIYAICDSDSQQVLYIGKAGTIQNNGTFKNQNLNGRLKAPRGKYNSSYLYFQNVMNDNSYDSLILVAIYSNPNTPPAYLESMSMFQFLNQNNCLPTLNNEF